jgi:TPR repeat protein
MRTSIAIAFALLVCADPVHAFDCVDSAAKHLKPGDDETAVAAVERGARLGDERCKFILGMWLISGAKAEQDPEKGVRYLKSASRAGLPAAQSALGLLYASGLLFERDDEKAAELYLKAAEYGDPLGQTALALACFQGAGVPQDRVEAYRWMSLAAEQENEKAVASLPAIREGLSEEELKRADTEIAQYRAKVRKNGRRPSTKELLRVVGLNRAPGEIERFFGLSF